MAKLRVFLADDHAVVRAGLKTLINAEPDMEVVGEAKNGREAFEKLSATTADVAVLDVSMPELNGAQTTRRLRENQLKVKVIALTVHEDGGYLRELLSAGASGYVLKQTAADELIRAIRVVAEGGVYIDSRVANTLVSAYVDSSSGTPKDTTELSARETESMRLIAQGYTTKEVAFELGVSSKTIETYKIRAMSKLGLKNRVDLVRAAAERGWFLTGK